MASFLPLALLLAAAAPEPRPPVRLPRLDAAPVIDCALEDPAWRQAAPLGGFVQTRPGINTPPSRATEVLVGYTPTALYVAVRAADDAGQVRATLAKRDAIEDDDTIALYLDTFHDRRRAYLVMVNPVGVQQDGVFVEGQSPDWSVDLVLESRGCLTEGGYAVEMAIPFESLRYEAGPGRAWGLHVVRQIKHLDEETSWMPLKRDSVGVDRTSTKEVRARFLSQAGTLVGLDEVRRRPMVELTPVGTVSQLNGHGGGDLGLTAKAALTSSLTADLAVNPDFAEVEADQPQLTANQRFPLFFEEKRPLFLEGAEVLRTPIPVFHSRTVIDPVGALKLSGRRGRTALAALLAADAAPVEGHHAAVGALRARRDVGERSSVGMVATTSNVAGRHNQVLGLDAQLALAEDLDATLQAVGTTASEKGGGFAYRTELAKTSARFTVQAAGEGYSPDYRAELGYTSRTDTNRWSLFTRYNAPPGGGGPLVSWSLLHTGLVQFDWRGRLQYSYLYPRLVLNLRHQTYVNVSAYRDYMRVFEEEFGPSRTATSPGAFAGESAERSSVYYGFTLDAGTAPSRALSLRATFDRSWNNLDFDLGASAKYPRVSPGALLDPHAPLDPGPAASHYASGAVVYQPAEALRLTLQYDWQSLRRNDNGRLAFDQRVASFRGQYALTRFAWVRARLDHDTVDDRLLRQLTLGWTPRPGQAIYAGYDETGFRHGQRLARTFFLKASWSARFRPGGSDMETLPRASMAF